MSEQWYYTRNRNQAGPVSADELKQLASSGSISPTDLVWKEGMPNWLPGGKIKGLFANPVIRATKRLPFSLPESLIWVKPVFLTCLVCLPIAYGALRYLGHDPLAPTVAIVKGWFPPKDPGPPEPRKEAIKPPVATQGTSSRHARLRNSGQQSGGQQSGGQQLKNGGNAIGNGRRKGPQNDADAQKAPQKSEVSTTDLESTARRAEELFREMLDAMAQARREIPAPAEGNILQQREAETKVEAALSRALGSGRKRIADEFTTLQGKTVKWVSPVAGVSDGFDERGRPIIAVSLKYVPRQPRLCLFFHSKLFNAGFHPNAGWENLVVGEHLPEALAKELNVGDRLLISGVVESVSPVYFRGSEDVKIKILLSQVKAERPAHGPDTNAPTQERAPPKGARGIGGGF